MSKVVSKRMVEETVHHPVWDVTYTCDRCGYSSDEATEFNTIIVQLDPGECVDAAFERHYHCGGVWEEICNIIKADPQDYSKSDFEDLWP